MERTPTSAECLTSTYKKHERINIRAHEQRVQEVEHGTFTPLVMSLSGDCGNAANVCYKRLASMLAEKWDQPYSNTLAWMRCKLSFALLRSAIQCIRGAHSASMNTEPRVHQSGEAWLPLMPRQPL